MSVSWRNILEQAASDLAKESERPLRRNRSAGPSSEAGSPWANVRDPMQEVRDLLDYELKAAAHRPLENQGSKPPAPPVRAPRPRFQQNTSPKRVVQPPLREPLKERTKALPDAARPARWGRNVAVVSVSVAVVGLTAHTFSRTWDAPPEVSQTAPAASVATAPAVVAASLAPEPTAVTAAPAEAAPTPSAPAPSPVTVAEPPAPQPVLVTAALPAPEPAPAPVSRPNLDPAFEERMLARAAQLLTQGDIAAARLTYENLAMSGSHRGALGAAETYDPKVLSSLFVEGLKPDAEKARMWYGKAAELGSETASRRLIALE